MNFVKIALEEIGDSIEEVLKAIALGNRLSNLEEKDFKEFMGFDKQPIKIDHEAQLKEFLNG